MREGPQLTGTLAQLVWGDVVQPLWPGLTQPEVCWKPPSLQSLCRDSVVSEEGCGSAVPGI